MCQSAILHELAENEPWGIKFEGFSCTDLTPDKLLKLEAQNIPSQCLVGPGSLVFLSLAVVCITECTLVSSGTANDSALSIQNRGRFEVLRSQIETFEFRFYNDS